jgi:acetyl-CoA acetyltransferase
MNQGAHPVTVAGVGIHPFGRFPQSGPEGLVGRAVDEALGRAGLGIDAIQEVFVGNALGPGGVAARVAEAIGAFRVPVNRIEQACASGSTALRLAADLVGAGVRDVVLVVGVETMGSGLLELGEDTSYQTRMGLTALPLIYGLKASQYIEACGASETELAEVAARAHRRAVGAPHARFGIDCTAEDVLASPMIAEPLTRLQLAGNADGAAAAVITRDGAGPRLRGWSGAMEWHDPAEVIAAGWDHREQLVEFLAAELYERTGVGPDDIGVVQLNDAASVAEPLYLESLGFAARGDGLRRSLDGRGGAAVNTDGGLLGRGHSLGATGLAMLYELWLQLQGDAGSRQLDPRPKAGLLHSHGLGGDNLFLIER